MTRPHIEFIQAQVLPWRQGLYGGARPDVEVKTLSMDDENGDSSLILRYPPGWTRPEPECLSVDEEIYILDGKIEINGIVYRENCYAYLPAGYVRRNAAAPGGAVALTFFTGEPRTETADPARESFDESLLVQFRDILEMPWETVGIDSNLDYLRPGKKYLWTHPRTGEKTNLFCYMPHSHPEGWKGIKETHPVVEECFVLTGQITGHVGQRRTGAYYWRPPGIQHGPFGSLTGAVALFRIRGGPLVNLWSEDEVPFAFDPGHNPVLPPELRELGMKEWQGIERY